MPQEPEASAAGAHRRAPDPALTPNGDLAAITELCDGGAAHDRGFGHCGRPGQDVPSAELVAALKSGRFRPSANADACGGFDVAAITVLTPLRDGLPDLGYVEAAG